MNNINDARDHNPDNDLRIVILANNSKKSLFVDICEDVKFGFRNVGLKIQKIFANKPARIKPIVEKVKWHRFDWSGVDKVGCENKYVE